MYCLLVGFVGFVEDKALTRAREETCILTINSLSAFSIIGSTSLDHLTSNICTQFNDCYSNNFWGWGGEDDEMANRLRELGIQFVAPDKGSLKDLEGMQIGEKIQLLKRNVEWKCMMKTELLDEHSDTWKKNGLADLRYNVLKQKPLDDQKKSTKITVDVKLNGDHHSNKASGVDYLADWARK